MGLMEHWIHSVCRKSPKCSTATATFAELNAIKSLMMSDEDSVNSSTGKPTKKQKMDDPDAMKEENADDQEMPADDSKFKNLISDLIRNALTGIDRERIKRLFTKKEGDDIGPEITRKKIIESLKLVMLENHAQISNFNCELEDIVDDVRKNVVDKVVSVDSNHFDGYAVAGLAQDLIRQVIEAYREKTKPQESFERVASIVAGIHTEYIENPSLSLLQKKISDVFEWYTKEHFKTFMSPSFAVIQSSGMGKTRLLMELANIEKTKSNFAVKKIICCKESISPSIIEEFDCPLDVSSLFKISGLAERRNELNRKLDELIKGIKHSKIVLIFDEAQYLLEENNHFGEEKQSRGYFYRCIRWWLRRERDTMVVAMFTGTSSSLANFAVDHDPPSTSSRDVKPTYRNYDEENKKMNPTMLYPPFFMLTTSGILHREAKKAQNGSHSELHRHIAFGRPLFAMLLFRLGDGDTDKLQLNTKPSMDDEERCTLKIEPKLFAILRRMLLSSKNKTGWSGDLQVAASVIGTRVQLGLTSFSLTDKLVKGGYAVLSDFNSYNKKHGENFENSMGVAKASFMPDPLCAYLAMLLMAPKKYTVAGDTKNQYVSECPKFWTKKFFELHSSKMSVLEKGDAAEMMCALYMLFCGDELRIICNKNMQDFAVSFHGWLERLKYRSATSTNGTLSDLNKSDPYKVNFIQICRDYFRSMDYLTNEEGLKHLYDRAVGVYTYPDCPAIDIVIPIRQECKNGDRYHPLAVSVKYRDNANKVGYNQIRKWHTNTLDQTKRLRHNGSSKSGCRVFSLVVLIGSLSSAETKNNVAEEESGVMFFSSDTVADPSGLSQNDICWTIVLDNDQFDIRECFARFVGRHELAEVYSSHAFAGSFRKEDPSAYLRTSSGETPAEHLVKELCSTQNE